MNATEKSKATATATGFRAYAAIAEAEGLETMEAVIQAVNEIQASLGPIEGKHGARVTLAALSVALEIGKAAFEAEAKGEESKP